MVCRPMGEITLKSFIFISYYCPCYLCRLHIQKSSPSFMSEPPFEIKAWRTLFKKQNKKHSVARPCLHSRCPCSDMSFGTFSVYMQCQSHQVCPIFCRLALLAARLSYLTECTVLSCRTLSCLQNTMCLGCALTYFIPQQFHYKLTWPILLIPFSRNVIPKESFTYVL